MVDNNNERVRARRQRGVCSTSSGVRTHTSIVEKEQRARTEDTYIVVSIYSRQVVVGSAFARGVRAVPAAVGVV
jgi:hypothetical protein